MNGTGSVLKVAHGKACFNICIIIKIVAVGVGAVQMWRGKADNLSLPPHWNQTEPKDLARGADPYD